MPIGKGKKPRIPKGYEGGEVIYEVTTKQTFWPKMKKSPKQAKEVKPKPMKVEVVNVVKTKTKGRKK